MHVALKQALHLRTRLIERNWDKFSDMWNNTIVSCLEKLMVHDMVNNNIMSHTRIVWSRLPGK